MTTIRTPEQLIQAGLSAPQNLQRLHDVRRHFDFKIPSSLVQKMTASSVLSLSGPASASDSDSVSDLALARQFVPSTKELIFLPEEIEDPIGDEAFTPVNGVTHRYRDRVLLKVTYTCGVYCRFCFRRYKVSKPEANILKNEMDQALEYIAQHPEIWEVILTGGDPLILSDEKLRQTLNALSQMPHVKVIRFHTRIPSVSPERITDHLIHLLQATRKSVWVAAHINSALELTSDVRAALRKLIDGGISVVGQSVFLRGVNDSFEAQRDLLRGLVESGVKPYYLHYPDLAKGTSHFRVPLSRVLEVYGQLRGQISGLCVPQLIVDIPGGHGKVSLEKARARHLGNELWEFESPLTGEWLKVQYPGEGMMEAPKQRQNRSQNQMTNQNHQQKQ